MKFLEGLLNLLNLSSYLKENYFSPDLPKGSYFWKPYKPQMLSITHYFRAKSLAEVLLHELILAVKVKPCNTVSAMYLQASGLTSVRSHLSWKLSRDIVTHAGWSLQFHFFKKTFKLVRSLWYSKLDTKVLCFSFTQF